MKLISYLSLISFMMILVLGCSAEKQEKESSVEKIALQLKWLHSAQFAGFYYAQEEGYSSDEKLQVTFIEGGPDIDQVEQILSGKVQFALVPAESLFLKNDAADPMVAIAVLVQRSPLVFAVKKGSDIIRPEDFQGKTIAVGKLTDGGFLEGIIQFNTLMKIREIDTSTVTIVPYDWSFKGFIDGSVDITPTYMNSGAIKLKYLGVEIDLIWPGDYGLEYYADTLVARKSFIREHPETVTRFLKAVIRGWQEAIAHPNKAIEYTLKYSVIKNTARQLDIMEAQTALIHTGTTPIGWMEREIWDSMYDILREEGLIGEKLNNIETLFDPSFLEDVFSELKE